MFHYKYKIEFKNKEVTNLFGEGYYCDKAVFWNAHQTLLNDLYNKVLLSEFPLVIIDLENDTSININNQKEFNHWILENQPFKIPV